MDGHSQSCGQQLSVCVDTMVFFRGLQVVLVLFNLFVADLDNNVECTFSKFVGDNNFCDVVNTVREGMTPRGTVTRYRGGSVRTSLRSTRPCARILHMDIWVIAIQCTNAS